MYAYLTFHNDFYTIHSQECFRLTYTCSTLLNRFGNDLLDSSSNPRRNHNNKLIEFRITEVPKLHNLNAVL